MINTPKLCAVILVCLASLCGCDNHSPASLNQAAKAALPDLFDKRAEALALLETARKYHEASDIDQAISSVDKAVMISDGFKYLMDINDIQRSAISLYSKLGAFDKVLSLERKNSDIIICRLCIVRDAIEQNKLEVAMTITSQLLSSFSPDWAETHALIAGGYARMDELGKANEILSQFSDAEDRAEIMTEMIKGQADIGKTKQAEILLGKLKNSTRSLAYLSAWPYIDASRYWIAEALVKQDDVDRAYELINKMSMHISELRVSSWKIKGLILVVEEKSAQGGFNEAAEILRTGVDSLHDQMVDESKLYSGAVASLVTHGGNEYAEEIINDVKAIKDPMVKAYCLLSIAEAYPNSGNIAAVESLLDDAVNTALSINQNLTRDYAYFKPLILIDSSELYFEKGLKEKALNGLKLANETSKTTYQQEDYNDAYSRITGTPKKQSVPVPFRGSYSATKRHTPNSVAKEFGFKDAGDFKKWYDDQ